MKFVKYVRLMVPYKKITVATQILFFFIMAAVIFLEELNLGRVQDFCSVRILKIHLFWYHFKTYTLIFQPITSRCDFEP